MADPFNRVAQGREGTGAAFVLSGNRAAEIFHQNVAEDEKQRRLLEFQRQKAEQERRSAIDANLSKLGLKDHWIRHNEELRGDFKNLWGKAAEIKAAGSDPFLDTDWKDQLNQLDANAAYSGDLKKQFDEFQKEIGGPNRDKYSEESIARRAAYFDNQKTLEQYRTEGLVPPPLEQRYSMSELLKGVNGSSAEYDANGKIIKGADRASNVKLAEGMEDTPAFKHFVKEAGGDPDGPAFPVNQKGKTIYSTRDEVLMPMVQKALEGLTEEELNGRTPEEAKAELLDYMKRQNAAKGSVIARIADQLDAGVDKSSRTDWQGKGTPLQWANHALSKERLALAKADRKDKEAALKKKGERSQYLADLKAAVLKGDPEGIARFNAFLATINGKAKRMDKYLRVDILKENKTKAAQSMMAAIMGKGEEIKLDNGERVVRYFIGNVSGAKGEIMLDNILKQIDLLKESHTPEEYSGELDDLGNEEVVTGEFDDID